MTYWTLQFSSKLCTIRLVTRLLIQSYQSVKWINAPFYRAPLPLLRPDFTDMLKRFFTNLSSPFNSLMKPRLKKEKKSCIRSYKQCTTLDTNTLLSVRKLELKKINMEKQSAYCTTANGHFIQELLFVISKLIDHRTQRPNKVNIVSITSYFPLLLSTDPFIYMPDQVPQERRMANKNRCLIGQWEVLNWNDRRTKQC